MNGAKRPPIEEEVRPQRLLFTEPQASHFWRNVDKTPGQGDGTCWKKPGSKSVRINGVIMTTSAAAFMFHYGINPVGRFVLRTCGYDWCCNPSHEVLGGRKDQYQLMRFKGRDNSGENNPNAQLTEGDVREIRSLARAGFSNAYIASRFKAARPTVSQIIHRKRWAHVEDLTKGDEAV